MKTFLATIFFLAVASVAQAFDISWVPATPTNQEGFKVYRKKAADASYTLLVSTLSATTSHSDPDRTIGNCYRVTAFNFAGESAPVEACANVPGAVTIIILK